MPNLTFTFGPSCPDGNILYADEFSIPEEELAAEPALEGEMLN